MASEFTFVSSSSSEEEEEEDHDDDGGPPRLISLSDQESPASSLTEL
jgi:hypothetical protein